MIAIGGKLPGPTGCIGTGCGIIINDPAKDICLSDPLIVPCTTNLSTCLAAGQYYVNGFDQILAVAAVQDHRPYIIDHDKDAYLPDLEPVPEDLRRFILTSVPSVPFVEAFLLYRERAGSSLPVDQVASRLCSRANIIRFRTIDEAMLALRTGRADAQCIFWMGAVKSVAVAGAYSSWTTCAPAFSTAAL